MQQFSRGSHHENLDTPEELGSAVGTVFNIQHYSIHDGPGIRTNVFVQGCPLRCIWCANPESQSPSPQLMYLRDKCVGCGACMKSCPHGAIALDSNRLGKVITDRDLCVACGSCVEVCPVDARSISGEEKTARQVFEEVSEDALFYGEDGGVTVTGGEPLAHGEFTRELLQLSKEAGFSTAIETCGFVSWETMRVALEYVDYVLYDIKQMSSDLHEKYTGVPNEQILSNLVKISNETNCTIFIRCPVIPPCNSLPEEMTAIARFLQENHIRVHEIDLLPYHRLGEGKRDELESFGETFTTDVPDEEDVERLRNILRGYGYTVH